MLSATLITASFISISESIYIKLPTGSQRLVVGYRSFAGNCLFDLVWISLFILKELNVWLNWIQSRLSDYSVWMDKSRAGRERLGCGEGVKQTSLSDFWFPSSNKYLYALSDFISVFRISFSNLKLWGFSCCSSNCSPDSNNCGLFSASTNFFCSF